MVRWAPEMESARPHPSADAAADRVRPPGPSTRCACTVDPEPSASVVQAPAPAAPLGMHALQNVVASMTGQLQMSIKSQCMDLKNEVRQEALAQVDSRIGQVRLSRAAAEQRASHMQGVADRVAAAVAQREALARPLRLQRQSPLPDMA